MSQVSTAGVVMAGIAWPVIHAERAALADDVAALTEQDWATPSLCNDWTVHQVLAHQVATARMTPTRFLGRFAAAAFNFTRMNANNVAEESAAGSAGTLARFRSQLTATTAPPGPGDSWLGEAIVHAEDIRRPLGIGHDYPLDSVTRAIEFYSRSNALIGGKTRVAGLTLKATDADWSHGSGPLVEGPAMSLLLATTGRRAGIEELAGPGLDILSARR